MQTLIQQIVKQAKELKDKYTKEKNAPVNYACIFAQNQSEFDNLLNLTKQIGTIIKETPMGPLFKITPITTIAGQLKLLKIRRPDSTRTELGDADFTVNQYSEFKKENSNKKEFKLIERENMEMLELIDPKFNVRAYFSYPPLDQQLNIL